MDDISVQYTPSGRSAYQVVPDPDDPIILQMEGKLIRVLDISANGFNVPEGFIAPGRRYPFSLDLPTAKAPISGYVDALPLSNEDCIQCLFVNLSQAESDVVHHYVLVRQKEALRSLRRSSSYLHL